MISRLLLTTAIGLALGSAALAQGTVAPSNTDSSAPVIADTQQAPAGSSAAVSPTVTLSEGVTVTDQDRSRIGDSIARMNVRSLRGVDFQVAVGSKVPRELRVYRLPAEVGQIVPPYRDYRFLVVEKQIVIVEPKANSIVAILNPDSIPTATATNAAPAAPIQTDPTPPPAAAAAPAPAPVVSAPATPEPAASPAGPAPTTTAAAPATADRPPAPSDRSAAQSDRPKAKKQASRSQRRTVKRAERDEWRRSSAEVRVGQRVPDGVVLYRVPPRYYREIPVAREYRYRGYAGGWRGRTIYQEFD